MSGERSVAPSRRRIEQARAAGQVAHSRELTAAAALGLALLVWGLLAGPISQGLLDLVRLPSHDFSTVVLDPAAAASLITSAARRVLLPVAGILAGGLVGALLAHHLQTAGLFVPSLAMPDPQRLGMLGRGLAGAGHDSDGIDWPGRFGPIAGQIARLTLVGLVLLATLRAGWPPLLAAMEQPWPIGLAAAASLVRSALGRIALALLFTGIVDFGLQWRRWRVRLQATPQEHRDEQRALEGDPAIRSRRQSSARSRLGSTPPAREVAPIGSGSSSSDSV